MLATSTAIAVGVAAASSSTPNAGTITPTSGAKSWTGGPFATPNPTGAAGGADCTAPNSCDDYALTVATPAGTGDTSNLSVAVSWPNTSADFDVYVLDAGQNVVAVSASSADPETVIMPPTSGTYTVRVVPYLPLGQSYSASASLVTKASDGAPGSRAPAPAFASYNPPETFTDAHNSGEPSIGYDPTTGATMYQSSLSTYKATFNDATSPATASWTNVSASATNGCPGGSTTSLDPILYTDRVTGRTFQSQLTGVDSLTCFTDDGGASWTPSQGGGIPSGVDHQTLGGGPFASADPLNGTNTYSRAVYYCSQDIAAAFCALSRNGGLTFGAGVPTYNLNQCGGLHGHLAIAADGTVYLPNKSCGANQGVVVSTDDGNTWAIRTVPHSVPGDSDPAVAVGSNGTLYYGYANGDGTAHVAVSKTKGATWSTDYNVGSALGIKNTVFPTAVAGDDNRAAISFLGTTTPGNYQDAANFHGVWHLYTAFTYDGGKTWKTVDDTPKDAVQRGSICTGGTTCGTDRNLLDFIGSTIDGHGRVEVGYADGCTGACVSGGPNNFDALASIARQSSGLSLFAADDPLANLTVSSLSATVAANGSSTIAATMSNTGAASATAPVLITVDGTRLSQTSAATVPAGGSVTFTVPWNTTGATGKHKIIAIADPADKVRESNETDNRTVKIVKVP